MAPARCAALASRPDHPAPNAGPPCPLLPIIAVLAVALPLLLGGCSAVPERDPVPPEQADAAQIEGIERARFWGDAPPPWFTANFESRSSAELKEMAPEIYGREHTYLAISGGGPDGAFGAGLLNGWTDTGARPQFTIVTGISTGALTAPLAFLGPEYDDELKEIYTAYTTADLVERRPWLAILTSDSVADTAPLRAKIAKYITPAVMEEIAAEHRKGRQLFIGTVNLDAGRPVIWNIGTIAASGAPGALDLIHDVMLASASIPGAFPPVRIDVVTPDGTRHQEMHVDGGTATQVFLYPLGLDWRLVLRKLEVPGKPRVYVIRNSKIASNYELVDAWLPAIAGRSISSLIRTQGIGDMYRMYFGAMRDGLDYNLAYVPDEFDVEFNEPFDPQYMRALYDLGYEMARDGYPWAKAPVGF